jgi:hypothetical protein
MKVSSQLHTPAALTVGKGPAIRGWLGLGVGLYVAEMIKVPTLVRNETPIP